MVSLFFEVFYSLTRDSLSKAQKGRALTKPTDTERRLVAIFAADVEGYSRLMGADEVGTLRDLTQRRGVLDGLIASYRGRIANTAGDSVLAEFGSAVDAVQCAVEAQAALAAANADSPPDRHINFRIGVHVGDVMAQGGDLFGDGVNIAARLQMLASAGGVCISAAAHDQVRKILPFAFADFGTQQVKNIEERVRAFGVEATAKKSTQSLSGIAKPLALPDKPSIAVLPFQNMSGDPDQEYFADGVVEDIITALSRVKWFFVIARNSSFAYKGKAVDIKQVGRELGVRYVLEGSVRKAGNRLRITGQLIEAATGSHIWADRFEGELADVFELQDKVTESVVAAIEPSLRSAEILRARDKPTDDLDAYDLYLRALQDYYVFSRESFLRAIELTDRAMRIDPHYGMAASLGSVLRGYGAAQGWCDASDILEARRLGELALTEDPDNAETIAWVGRMIAWADRDFGRAKEMADKAVAIDQNSALAWAQRGWVYHYSGEPDEAILSFQRAIRLSPRDRMLWSTFVGKALAEARSGRYGDAVGTADRARIQNPAFSTTFRCLASCFANLGRMDEARAAAKQLLVLEPKFSISDWFKRSGTGWSEEMVEGLRKAGLPE
jgi:adenylate cyclase